MEKKSKKAVATVSSQGGIIIGHSDVIRYGDIVNINGYDIDTARAVDKGIELNIPIAKLLIDDLRSEIGLLITFPLARLMSDLQEKMGSGQAVLDAVKPL